MELILANIWNTHIQHDIRVYTNDRMLQCFSTSVLFVLCVMLLTPQVSGIKCFTQKEKTAVSCCLFYFSATEASHHLYCHTTKEAKNIQYCRSHHVRLAKNYQLHLVIFIYLFWSFWHTVLLASTYTCAGRMSACMHAAVCTLWGEAVKCRAFSPACIELRPSTWLSRCDARWRTANCGEWDTVDQPISCRAL